MYIEVRLKDGGICYISNVSSFEHITDEIAIYTGWKTKHVINHFFKMVDVDSILIGNDENRGVNQ